LTALNLRGAVELDGLLNAVATTTNLRDASDRLHIPSPEGAQPPAIRSALQAMRSGLALRLGKPDAVEARTVEIEDPIDPAALYGLSGQLWVAVSSINGKDFFRGSGAGIVSRPPYPYKRRSYWLPPRSSDQLKEQPAVKSSSAKDDTSGWFYRAGWARIA